MKMKYVKTTPRITIKIVDGDTEEILLEYTDRTWMTVGEMFQDFYVSELIKNDLPSGKKVPKNLMVLAVAEYSGQ